ncbi:hypothetical protein ACVWZ4_003806 [Bradyrhizobium sp. USDA 4472]
MGEQPTKPDEGAGSIIGDPHPQEEGWELDDPEAQRLLARKRRIAVLIGLSGLLVVAIAPPVRTAVAELFCWFWITVIAYLVVPWMGFILLILAVAAASGVLHFFRTGKLPGLDDTQ